MLECKLCSLPAEFLLFFFGGGGNGRRSSRLRLKSAESEAEALLCLAELGNIGIIVG